MVRKLTHIAQTTLRFRRWSRKAYAAFVSIHRQVTMGHLAASLTERFQAKQQALHGWMEGRSGANLSDEEKMQASDLPDSELLQVALEKGWVYLVETPVIPANYSFEKIENSDSSMPSGWISPNGVSVRFFYFLIYERLNIPKTKSPIRRTIK